MANYVIPRRYGKYNLLTREMLKQHCKGDMVLYSMMLALVDRHNRQFWQKII